MSECVECGGKADGSEIRGEPACAECARDLDDRAYFECYGGQR